MGATTQLTYIYGLKDPRTGEIRYVGKANNPQRRLTYHLCDSQLSPKTHRNYWLRSLRAIGLKPSLVILETLAHGECWKSAEKRWIRHFLDAGAKLTNGTEGGDGLHNPTDEVRLKCGASRKGKRFIFTKEHKEKIAAANRARANDPAWRLKMSLAMIGNKNNPNGRRGLVRH